MTDDLCELAAMWITAKEAEAMAVSERREIEDRIKSLAGVSENIEGTETVSPPGFVIKVTGRLDRKVDIDKLQELAAEHGLSEHLSSLFRWKPELNMSVWKATSDAITAPLSKAITTKPGRPSINITRREGTNEW